MTYLREVVSIDRTKFDDLSNVRWAAAGVLEWFEAMIEEARRWRKECAAARTVEKVTIRYGRWLGRYHSARVLPSIFIRELERQRSAHVLNAPHGVALEAVNISRRILDEYAASPHPWMSLPNLANTKFHAMHNLDAVVGECEVIISHLHRLQGLQPDERKSA
jgi:hypothetical protein